MQMIRFIFNTTTTFAWAILGAFFLFPGFLFTLFSNIVDSCPLRFKFQELFEVESFVFPCAINKLFLGCAFSQKAKKSLKIVKLHE